MIDAVVRCAAIVAVLCCMPDCVSAQAEGPLGLTWGQSSSQIKEAGVELKDVPLNDFGKSFFATNLPRALADQKHTLLSFGHDDKLWRVVLLGREVDNDPMGLSVKSRYEELKQILEEKYGKARTFQTLGDSIYAEAQYFLAGIRSGKSFWQSSFGTNSVAIDLSIIASDSSTGQWRIIFEDKNGRRVFDNSKKAREKKAL